LKLISWIPESSRISEDNIARPQYWSLLLSICRGKN
jgi:hypothetical protein